MIHKRQFRENDPALGILDKAFRFVVVVFGFILDIDGCIAMTDSCGRTKEYRCFIFFGVFKCFLNHLISFLGGRRVETRDLGKSGKMSCILLGLGRNRSRIIGNENDHATFDSNIFQTHKWIRCNI